MNDDNKKRLEEFGKVLLLVGLITLAIAASFGCFNYATLASKTGDPDGIFWLIGFVNIVYNGFAVYKISRKLFPKKKAEAKKK